MDRILNWIYGFGSIIGTLIIIGMVVVFIAFILFILYGIVLLSYILVPVAVGAVMVIFISRIIYKAIRGK